MAFKKTIVLDLDSSEFSKGIEDANRDIDKLDDNLEDLESNVDQASESLEDMGDSAKEAGNAVVDMSQQFKNGIEILSSVAQSVMAVERASMDYAKSIQSMAQETGLSTEAVQALDYVATQTGTDMEHVSSAMTSLQRAMASAASGTGEAYTLFRQLDVAITDSNGDMRDTTQVFFDVIGALNQMSNSTEQSQAALKVFGDSAKDLNGMIEQGTEGIAAMVAQFQDLGIAVSDEDIQSLVEAQKSVEAMKASFMTAAAELMATFAPAITAVMDFLTKLSPEAKQIIMVVAALTATIIGLSLAISAVGMIYTTMMSTMGMATMAFESQAAPILLLVAALAALALAIKAVIDDYKEWQQLTGGSGFFNYLFGSNNNPSQRSGGGHSRNAKGTPYWQGGLTWVGEEGPELVDLPTGSRIYNNQQSTSIGGNTYNVNMNMDMSRMKSINDVVEAVEGLKTSAGCTR